MCRTKIALTKFGRGLNSQDLAKRSGKFSDFFEKKWVEQICRIRLFLAKKKKEETSYLFPDPPNLLVSHTCKIKTMDSVEGSQ